MVTVAIPHRLGSPTKDLVRAIGSVGDVPIVVVADRGGIPEAFNRCLRAGEDEYTVILCDDAYITRGSVLDLPDPRGISVPSIDDIQKIENNPKWVCCWCFPRWVVRTVGLFDTRFSPAYYEDDDYIIRLKLARIPLIHKPAVIVSHPRPGATIERIEGIREIREESKRQFEAKWNLEPVEPEFIL
jgi:GT2 family glycosyltransferase